MISKAQKVSEQNQNRSIWSVFKQVMPPVILVWLGLTLLICGALFHSKPVLVEKEITPPAPPAMPMPSRPPFFNQPGGPPRGASPMFIPPPQPPPAPEKVLVTLTESEPLLIREVTIGGVTRLATGQLKRTYTGETPSLCPT